MDTSSNVDIPADIAAALVNPAAYADHRIHDSYRWLRANNPLGIARPEKFDPFWVVTKHTHIQAVSRQNELFHIGCSGSYGSYRWPCAGRPPGFAMPANAKRMLLHGRDNDV